MRPLQELTAPRIPVIIYGISQSGKTFLNETTKREKGDGASSTRRAVILLDETYLATKAHSAQT